MKRIRESEYTDRINALKGMSNARTERDANRAQQRIIDLRKDLEEEKKSFLAEYDLLLKKEVPYVKEALAVEASLKDAGIEIPDWFYGTFDQYGVVPSDDDDRTGFGILYAGSFDKGIVLEEKPYYFYDAHGYFIDALRNTDFTKTGDVNPLGDDVSSFADAPDFWWNSEKELIGEYKDYSEAIAAMHDITTAREQWFEKLDAWLSEKEKSVNSDLDGDGKIGEDYVRSVTKKILEGADVRTALS